MSYFKSLSTLRKIIKGMKTGNSIRFAAYFQTDL